MVEYVPLGHVLVDRLERAEVDASREGEVHVHLGQSVRPRAKPVENKSVSEP